jgi:DNA-binding transcriptional regulator YiaG
MEKKIQKKYVDHGCGFPVLLHNVTMVKVRNVWTPQINYNDFSKSVVLSLSANSSRLTGNQIKFIRLYFEMTLKEFGQRFGVTHPAVIAWESKENRASKMDWATEKDIRLEIVKRILGNSEEIGNLFSTLSEKPEGSSDEIEVNLVA